MHIKVNQGEFESVTSPDTISSGAFCTCFIVGVWNQRLRKAYLLHDDAPLMHEVLPGFLEMILAESNPVDLIIKAYGGGEFDSETREYVADNREYVRNTLAYYKLTPAELRFFDEHEGADLLITGNGEFILSNA